MVSQWYAAAGMAQVRLRPLLFTTLMLWTAHAERHLRARHPAIQTAEGCQVGEKAEITVPPMYTICLHPPGELISDFVRQSGHWMDCVEYATITTEAILLDIKRSIEMEGNARKLQWLAANSILSPYLSGIVVDVGANIGTCAFDLAQLGHRIYAFEFQKHNWELMKSTMRLNDFKGQVDIFNVVVSNETKTRVTVATDINSGNMGRQGATELSRNLLGVSQHVTLPAVRLDDVVGMHVNFMKLDCQGCEYLALLGAEKIFEDHGVDLVYLEFSPPSMAKSSSNPRAAEDTLHMLLKYGMDIWVRNHKYVRGKGMTVLHSTADVDRFMNDAPFNEMPDGEMDMYAVQSGTAFPQAILDMIS